MTGIYIHVPFCSRKCSYCDFYSVEQLDMIESWVQSLKIEIAHRRVQQGALSAPARSVFFGGGTPSLLTPLQLASIAVSVREHFDVAADAEWTMECNPGTVSLSSLTEYRNAGINRLSFGVQSLNATELVFLDRIHSSHQALDAMSLARDAGFTNVNVDIMFALPGQSVESLRNTLDVMLATQPEHISAYALIFEPGTPLYARMQKGLVSPAPADVDAGMYSMIIDRLRSAGYEQYEVSNFARQGFRCQHNLLYWHAGEYVAFGPGAHGYSKGRRYFNHRSLRAWTEAIKQGLLPEAGSETPTARQLMEEYAFLHLRADGMDLDVLRNNFGVHVADSLTDLIQTWQGAGFVSCDGTVVTLTAAGYALCDELTVQLLRRL